MKIKCGIIGLPNVGKSTLFNIITNSKVKNKNFPFCTINPNYGHTNIYCNKIHKISKISKTKKIILPTIQYIDIAGLIKGSSKNLGIGNKFLEDIRKVNILLHVIKIFKNKKIINFYNKINIIKNIKIINNEILFSDINLLKKIKKKIKKNINKNIYINTINNYINNLKKKNIKNINLNSDEKKFFKNINLLTKKKKIYIFNISNKENINKQQKKIKQIKQYLSKENNKKYFVSLDIKKIYKNKKQNQIKNNQEKKINKIKKISFKLLKLKKFFTINKKETRLWIINKNDNILKAAKKIHSDFMKKFIRAEVINCKTYIKYKGWNKHKKNNKIKNKKYIPKNGDIIKILINKK